MKAMLEETSGRVPGFKQKLAAWWHGYDLNSTDRVLEEEGLVSRAQGKGTYVRKIGVSTSSFRLDAMTDALADKDNLSVKILKATIKKT